MHSCTQRSFELLQISYSSTLRKKTYFGFWKESWYELRGNSLLYYRRGKDVTIQDSSPARQIVLGNFSIYEDTDSKIGEQYCFSIVTDKEALNLTAGNSEQRKKWIEVLHKLVSNIKIE